MKPATVQRLNRRFGWLVDAVFAIALGGFAGWVLFRLVAAGVAAT